MDTITAFPIQANQVPRLAINLIQKARVLVIDDDAFMRILIETMLKDIGVKICESASTGKEALSLLDSSGCLEYQCILCDLNMPEMDGIEFFRELKNRNFKGGIIIISGVEEQIIRSVSELVVSHGLNYVGLIRKPFSKNTLERGLLEAISQCDNKDQSTSAICNIDDMSKEELLDAIQKEAFSIYYQPKINLHTNEIDGCEALVRGWNNGCGLIMPDHFISVAEEYGLIQNISKIVIRKTLSQIERWNQNGLSLNVSINISLKDLWKLHIFKLISSLCDSHNVDPSNLTLEITESSLSEDLIYNLETLNRLRIKGIKLSVDDFGTGYSTLDNIKKMPFTELKIDKSFIAKQAQNKNSSVIARSCVSLAKQLGMSVVAEGIESEEEHIFVKDINCDYVQGYFYSKPLEGNEFEYFCQKWTGEIL